MMLALALPASALAVTEGVVEDAPPVELEEEAAPVSYLPDESYYVDGYEGWEGPIWENAVEDPKLRFDGDCYQDVEQRPRLTAGESARAKALLAQYEAGEIAYAGEDVLGKTQQVVVGVYALDPADYDGERAFLLLPGTWLTDEQLLSIIDAYAQLGLTFDPDALNARNCARGGGIETTRLLTEDEYARSTQIARLIERGLLTPPAAQEGVTCYMQTDSRYYCGLEGFALRPYRRLTDEELCAMLVQLGARDRSGEADMDELERRAREALCGQLDAALSMELVNLSLNGSYMPALFDAKGNIDCVDGEQSRDMYFVSFAYHTPDGVPVYAYAMFDAQTGEIISLCRMHEREWTGDGPSQVKELSREDVLAVLADVEERLALEDPVWLFESIEPNVHLSDWGSSRVARALLEDDLMLTVYIGLDDGEEHGLELQRGTLVETLPAQGDVNG